MTKYSALSILALGALGAAGCAADATGASASPGEQPESVAPKVEASPGKVLAVVTLAEGHTITFEEIRPGTLGAGETVPPGAQPLGHKGGSILELYRSVTGGAEPPAALVSAEATRLAMAKASRSVATAAAAAPTNARPMMITNGKVPSRTAWETSWTNANCSEAQIDGDGCLWGDSSTLGSGEVFSGGGDATGENAEGIWGNDGTDNRSSGWIFQSLVNGDWVTDGSGTLLPGYTEWWWEWHNIVVQSRAGVKTNGSEGLAWELSATNSSVQATQLSGQNGQGGPIVEIWTTFPHDNKIDVSVTNSAGIVFELGSYSPGTTEFDVNFGPYELPAPILGSEYTVTATGTTTGQVATTPVYVQWSSGF